MRRADCFRRAYFYPRPPRGGRPVLTCPRSARKIFLSTPSARRATWLRGVSAPTPKFLSTPSARRATDAVVPYRAFVHISIHALREEGDLGLCRLPLRAFRFLSTPSARRATDRSFEVGRSDTDFYPRPPRGGRPGAKPSRKRALYFYPRPPRGGRHAHSKLPPADVIFLSTPSARRATSSSSRCLSIALFLSTPSARRATLDGGRSIVFEAFLSTPSARRATRRRHCLGC